jgi:hypothetical protein
MKTFQYVVMRAQGIVIIVGLCMALGGLLGLIAWAANGAVGSNIAGYLLGVPIYMGTLALITNTPIAKSIARDVESMVAIIILLLLVTIPFWTLVFPVQMFAFKLGWIQRADE